jgi:hypothetical protein
MAWQPAPSDNCRPVKVNVFLGRMGSLHIETLPSFVMPLPL